MVEELKWLLKQMASADRLPASAYMAFALCILGSKLLLIALYGVETPFWDQWDCDVFQVLIPWQHHTLRVSDLLAPHNEHRILPTRLLMLVLFMANHGIWNPLLQMVAGSLFHVAALTVLVIGICRTFKGWAVPVFLLASCIYFSIPFGWENTLWGFQSQFYFLLLFSFGAFFLNSFGSSGAWRWYGGVVLALAAAVSFASGLIALLVLAMMFALRWRRERELSRYLLAALLAVAGAITVWSLMPTASPNLGAHDMETYRRSLLRLWCWPSSVLANTATLAIAAWYLACNVLISTFQQRAKLVVVAVAVGLILYLSQPYLLPAGSNILMLFAFLTPLYWLARDTGAQGRLLPLFCLLWLLVTVNWEQAFVSVAAIAYLPMVLFLVTSIVEPFDAADERWFLLAIAFWLCGQFGALALARSARVDESRYMDIIDIGVVLNAALLVQWTSNQWSKLPWRSRLLPGVWVLVTLMGLCVGLSSAIQAGYDIKAYSWATHLGQQHVADYLRTGNPAHLTLPLPYPEVVRLKQVLDTPEIRTVLPPSLVPENGARQSFWVIWLLSNLQRVSWLIVALGVFFWGLTARQLLRRKQDNVLD